MGFFEYESTLNNQFYTLTPQSEFSSALIYSELPRLARDASQTFNGTDSDINHQKAKQVQPTPQLPLSPNTAWVC